MNLYCSNVIEQSLAQKIDKIKVNLKNYYVTYDVSYDFYLESHNVNRLHIEQSL